MAPAQEPGGATTPPATPPVTPPAPPAQEPAPAKPPEAAAAITYGRIVAEQAPLRCWPGAVAQPPVYEEVLAKDQVVVLGRSENGFRAVLLPLGPLGFVSKKFTEVAPTGQVKTKAGSKVAFRYRPRSSEAPVTLLAEGTELQVVGEQDDWFRTRVPGLEAWVAEAEVQVADAADPAVAKAHDELQQKHAAEVKARLDAIAAQAARAAQDQIDLAAVRVVEEAFAAELKKPPAQQQHEPLDAALDKLVPTLAEDSAGRPAVAALKKRIEAQRMIVEAINLVNDRPPITEGPPPEKKDQLERFQSIGWLRYERRLAAPGVFYLEKGGQRQYVLSCNTGRYDLSLFVDCEVGVIGPRRRPVTESLSVIDVERLEVLGAPTK